MDEKLAYARALSDRFNTSQGVEKELMRPPYDYLHFKSGVGAFDTPCAENCGPKKMSNDVCKSMCDNNGQGGIYSAALDSCSCYK